MKYNTGDKVQANGNTEAVIIGYDTGLDMYNVRMWDGLRHVGDVILPEESITALGEVKISDDDLAAFYACHPAD